MIVSANPEDSSATLLDTRGHRCPTPTLRLRRALEAAAVGDTILVLADDPLARVDLPHYVASARHELVRLEVEGNVLRALVRKAKGSNSAGEA